LQFPFLPQNLPRKKKRKLMPSLPLPLQLLPQQLRQQRLPKVSLLRKTQLKQTPKQPHQHPNNLEDNDDIVIDDEVTFGRNRRSSEFGKVIHEDEDLSDYVLDRLYLARMLALKKHQEVWT
jgi:hypothetical protein